MLILLNVGLITGSILVYQRLETAKSRIPELSGIMAEVLKEPSQIYSADGDLLQTIAAEYRDPVPIDEIPDTVINATIAAEDERFYGHNGVDFIAVARVAKELLTGATQTGGSTITMQIAKRVYTSPEQTLSRKFDDMALAIQLERTLTKNQILELYLNQIFYGRRAYGIKAAADVYFGKTLEELTIAEAALLARCVRRPTYENPVTNSEIALSNRDVVLKLMKQNSLISQEEYDEALAEPLKLRTDLAVTEIGIKDTPFFVDYVTHEVRLLNEQRTSRGLDPIVLSGGGYRIETTINREYQRIAEEEVAKAITENTAKGVTTGAFVLMDTDGRIVTMIGGRDYDEDQYNITAQGGRQPGSAFKPFVYAAALERGLISPHGTVDNSAPYYYPLDETNQRPKAVGGGGPDGPVSVEEALRRSLNRAACRVMEAVGPANVVSMAKRTFGFESKLNPYHSLVLGTSEVRMLEMAEAYSVFQQNGTRVEPWAITSITGPNGQIIYRGQSRIHKNVMGKMTAENMDRLLRAVGVMGSGHRAGAIAANVRGKTGTTQENKDAWFCGYTDEFVGIMWLSNLEISNGRKVHKEMSDAAEGGKVSAPTWGKILKRIQELSGEEARRFKSSFEGEIINLIPEEPEEEEGVEEGLETGGGIIGTTGGETTEETTAGGDEGTGTGEQNEEEENNTAIEYIFVEVCADSEKPATFYCPERYTKRFAAGAQALEVCPLHGGH